MSQDKPVDEDWELLKSFFATELASLPAVLHHAGAVLAHDTLKKLAPDELPLICGARLLQAATEFRCALP